MGYKSLCNLAFAYFSHLLSDHFPPILVDILSPFRSVNKASSFLSQAPKTCQAFCLENTFFPLLLAVLHKANSLIKISPHTSPPSLTTISKYAPSSFSTTALPFPSHTYHNLKLHIYCLFTCFFFFAALGLRCVFVAAHGLSLVAASRGYSLLWCVGFSMPWLLLFRSTVSRRVGFSSCGTWAQQLWLAGSRARAQQLWCTGFVAPRHVDLPGPGIKPVSPALAGRFLITRPPGKSSLFTC